MNRIFHPGEVLPGLAVLVILDVKAGRIESVGPEGISLRVDGKLHVVDPQKVPLYLDEQDTMTAIYMKAQRDAAAPKPPERPRPTKDKDVTGDGAEKDVERPPKQKDKEKAAKPQAEKPDLVIMNGKGQKNA